jgi:uncharacterized protein (DUF1697 family)
MSDTSSTYIALFRGINVGGKNSLPMKELVAIMEDHGCTGIRTYIQSGNVVFESSRTKVKSFTKNIGESIKATYGFKPQIMVLTAAELRNAAAANPFPEAENGPKSLHMYFLADTPQNPDIKTLNELKTDNESFNLIGQVFYLHAPDGIGRSKLAARVEKSIGVRATARNWNTITKLLELIT